jgi:transcription antitermination protein NusB
MSFENQAGKSSGTRRKARECALQMLFAFDLAGRDNFSAVRYWSELGYEEIHPGNVRLIEDFRDQVAKFEQSAVDFRGWLKRAEPYEKSTSRTDKAKDLARSSETLLNQYRTYIDRVVEGEATDPAPLFDQLRGMQTLFDRLIADVDATIKLSSPFVSVEDRTQYADLKDHGRSPLDKLLSETLPDIEKIFNQAAPARQFCDRLFQGSIDNLELIDARIRTRAEHWRIERMAIVDRNVLRLAVYEFLFEDTPHTVVINEGLEVARKFSTFEATQFINGILASIRLDLEKERGEKADGKSQASSI